MALSIEDIRRAVRERRGHETISKAIDHQHRIQFHVRKHVAPYLSSTLTAYLSWVGQLIPEDKLSTFKTLFRFPVLTNDVCDTIFDELSRVFDGRNPAYNYQFATTEQRDDWEWYRQEVLHEPTVWQQQGWEYFKTEINSVLVVDLPLEQDAADSYPRPYFYWLTIDRVVAFAADASSDVMKWVAFRQDDDKLVAIDDTHYRVFEYRHNTLGALLVETAHGLGYCPSRFFWSEPLSLSEPNVKSSPITKVLEALDWYLFFSLSKRHLDLYGAYPIYSGYEADCDYSQPDNTYCDRGFLRDRDNNYLLTDTGSLQRCPRCGNRRIAGAGSFVEIPIPSSGDGMGNVPDLRNPIQMLSVDTGSLAFNVEEAQRLRDNIITSVVGQGSSIINAEALNERQVDANFESRSTVLNRIKKGFEAAQQFVDETVCRLRYGSSFLSARVNLGTEFYTMTPSDLRNRYNEAKANGASEAELDAMHRQIVETEYRHNPTELQRLLILGDLEPYQHMTRDEVIDLYSRGLIGQDDLLIKLHFGDYVRRFERENMNVIEFGAQAPYDKKILIINETFRRYANEERTGLARRETNAG